MPPLEQISTQERHDNIIATQKRNLSFCVFLIIPYTLFIYRIAKEFNNYIRQF